MRVLVADDDPVVRKLLQTVLEHWGHRVVLAADGLEAWQFLAGPEPPELAIVDWVMPGLDGPELCRRARRLPACNLYVILLTSRYDRQDVIDALEAGADDYVTKPFDAACLRARLSVGIRVVSLQRQLAARVGELERALDQVDQLHGLLAICSYCRRIRSDGDYWEQIEAYMAAHSALRFSHGICPDCLAKVHADLDAPATAAAPPASSPPAPVGP